VLFSLTQGLCEVFSGNADIGISRLEQLLPRAQRVGWYVDDVLRALIRAHEKAGDLRRALEYVDQLALSFSATRTRQLHQQLAQIQQDVLGELDPASHAQILLGDQAADLRVKSFSRTVAERERTLLENWAVAASLIDDETGHHCFRVGRLCYLMAVRLGYDEARAETIEMAGRLHDIGKIGINHQILLKPSMLTEAERVIIRKHPTIGAEMLSRSTHPGAQLAATVAGSHHERWDGTGYPAGLRGEDIPIETRIVTLADVYDVLTTGRPYKKAWPHEMAVDELLFMGGKQFDPNLVESFAEMVNEYVAMYGEAGDDAYRLAVQDSAMLKGHGNIKRLLADPSAKADRVDI
jgi:putative two-component system response regulator